MLWGITITGALFSLSIFHNGKEKWEGSLQIITGRKNFGIIIYFLPFSASEKNTHIFLSGSNYSLYWRSTIVDFLLFSENLLRSHLMHRHVILPGCGMFFFWLPLQQNQSLLHEVVLLFHCLSRSLTPGNVLCSILKENATKPLFKHSTLQAWKVGIKSWQFCSSWTTAAVVSFNSWWLSFSEKNNENIRRSLSDHFCSAIVHLCAQYITWIYYPSKGFYKGN